MTNHTHSPSKLAATGNIVEGFSARFNSLLDRAHWPKENRITIGSKKFKVVPNTFKHWVVGNRLPGTHAALLDVVQQLLKEVPGRHNAKAVSAWLVAGDAVPHPFGEDNFDSLKVVNLYLEINTIAKNLSIDFNKLPHEVRNRILNKVRAMQPDAKTGEKSKMDPATVSYISGMLETAKHQ